MSDKINNGYYISAYCDIDPLGNILDSSVRHDQNIALWEVVDNKVYLLHHWELERITGLKHHQTSFFSEEDFILFVNELLVPYDITNENIQQFIGMKDIDRAAKINFDDKIAYHSLCHMYASLGMESDILYNDKILALSIDAAPDIMFDENSRDKYYFAGAYSDCGNIDIFPINSPGILWTEAAYKFGLQEGSLMALATASRSKSYISYPMPLQIMNKEDMLKSQLYLKRIIKDIMTYTIKDQGIKFNFFDVNFTEKENKISMIMKIIQNWSIEIIDKCIDEAILKYHVTPSDTCIALSGGYSLNCPTNTHIIHKYGFKKQLIVPCVNDGGQSIGSGLMYFYEVISKVEFNLKHSYWGNKSDSYDEKFNYFIENIIDDGLDYLVDDVTKNPIVWFTGRSEIGPRALGHRSLIADPRTVEAKDKLNIIKQREWWRPVAPMVLETECNEWFEKCFSSPYMLNNFMIQKDKKKLVPAILHLDDTCRIQTVNQSDDLLFVAMDLFYKKTGIPILCNTSLNDKGEPIIDTIDQAFNFALRKKIEMVYINGKRYKMTNFDEYMETKPLMRKNELFVKYRSIPEVFHEVNPYGVTAEQYNTYKDLNIGYKFNFNNEKDTLRFKRILKKMVYLYNLYTGRNESI